MTSRLHFELFLQHVRGVLPDARPNQTVRDVLHNELPEDVGTVRLSHLKAALRQARADRPDE